MANPNPAQLMSKVKAVSIICIIIGVVMGLSNLIESTAFGSAGAHLTERLRVRMFAHMLRQHVGYFDERANCVGALCARLAGEAAQVQGIAIEAVSNVRTVASLGREQGVVAEYVARLRPALAPAKRSAHCRGLVAGLSRSVFNFVNAAALTYGGHLIVSDGVACEHILITTQSLQMASSQAQNAFGFAPDFQRGITAGSRVIRFLNTAPKIADPRIPAVTPFISSGEASFKGVEFKYPTRPNVRVLRGLDLFVERGKTIALVGQSGCGKSTVVQLLQRFYDPDAGKVALDGVPLPELRVDDVRAGLGLVSQEPVLFDRTIGENIAYGDNSRAPAHHEIVAAATHYIQH